MAENNYEALVSNRIFVGGIDGVNSLLENEKINVIFDLRSNKKEHPAEDLRVHQPIVDDMNAQAESIKLAVEAIMDAYNEGKNVFFHCTSGNGRASTMAIATLMELGLAKSVDEAEQKIKVIRPQINVKADQKRSLEKIYPDK